MLIEITDAQASEVGGAMVERACRIMELTDSVPAYLYQYADLWDKGVKYSVGGDFWFACYHHVKRGNVRDVLSREGLINL